MITVFNHVRGRAAFEGSNNGRVNPIESASWLAASYNVPTFHRVNGRSVRSWRFYRNRFPANEGYLTPVRPTPGRNEFS